MAGERNRWPLRLSNLRRSLRLLVAGTVGALNLQPVRGRSADFEDVIFGVKFHGDEARVTMALQAIVIGVFGIGILMRQRWGAILALLYMAQVVAGHVIFITSNLGVESQRVHVKIASYESPVVLLIALYVWYRSAPELRFR